ncbi:MAG: helix-turn-helix domain-containing protein [Lentisphaeria bacterium]|nr:helix-turn-helix domain-containing protein [Lentisphaeria bacterium]
MKSSLMFKAASILEAICASKHPVAIKELTGILDLPLPTVSRLCADLIEIGLLEKTDYHHLVPGISLMRLGYQAKFLSPLLEILKATVDDHSRSSGLNAAVFGYQHGAFFEIYNFHQNNPLQDPLRLTGAYLVLLAASGTKAETAQEIVRKKYPDMPVTEQIICDREFSVLQTQKTLTRVAPHRKWAITMPFIYDGIVCTLSFYGTGKEERNVEAEVFEVSKVLSRIRTAVDRAGKGEE